MYKRQEMLRAEVLVYECAPISDPALGTEPQPMSLELLRVCLLYTSDAADERSSVDLGGRRILKKKKTIKNRK